MKHISDSKVMYPAQFNGYPSRKEHLVPGKDWMQIRNKALLCMPHRRFFVERKLWEALFPGAANENLAVGKTRKYIRLMLDMASKMHLLSDENRMHVFLAGTWHGKDLFLCVHCFKNECYLTADEPTRRKIGLID